MVNGSKINYWVDVGLLISFLLVAITGVMKMFNSRQLWVLHDWSGIAMGTLVLVHLFLHRHWMMEITKDILKKEKIKTRR